MVARSASNRITSPGRWSSPTRTRLWIRAPAMFFATAVGPETRRMIPPSLIPVYRRIRIWYPTTRRIRRATYSSGRGAPFRSGRDGTGTKSGDRLSSSVRWIASGSPRNRSSSRMTRCTPGSRERDLACRPISSGVGVSRTSTPASRYPSPASFSIRAITWLIFRPFRAGSVLQDQEVAKLGLGEIHEPCANDHPQVADLAQLVQQEGNQRPPAERIDARETPRRAKEHAIRLAFDDGQEGNSLGGRRQGREGPAEEGPSGLLDRFRERRRRPDPVEGVPVEDPPPGEKMPVPVHGDDPILDFLQYGHEVRRVDGDGDEQGKGVLPIRPRGGRPDLPEPHRRLLEPGSVQGQFQDCEVPRIPVLREGPEE